MSKTCKVCGQPAFAVHFGAMTCRACAMFFRRKARNSGRLLKGCTSNCKIDKFSRKTCASCRFSTCLKAGMTQCAPSRAIFAAGPILAGLQNGYNSLENARKLAFALDSNKVPKASTYTMQNNVIAIDFRLITNHLISVQGTFQRLQRADQKTLLSQFIAPFHILESTYKATEPNRVMLANGDYIDHEDLERYYKDLFDVQHQQAFRVFKPYWDLQHRIIRSGLDDVQLDSNEFLFLVALMLWDIDFHNCEEELMMTCMEEKRRIVEELCDYEKHREMGGELTEDRSMRVGRVMMMLNGMQRTLNMLYESHEVSKCYQLDTLHDTFFDLLKGF